MDNPDQTAKNESPDSNEANPPMAENEARAEEPVLDEFPRRPPSPVTYEALDVSSLSLNQVPVAAHGFSVEEVEERLPGGADPDPGAGRPGVAGAPAAPPAVAGAPAAPPAAAGAPAAPPAVAGAPAAAPVARNHVRPVANNHNRQAHQPAPVAAAVNPEPPVHQPLPLPERALHLFNVDDGPLKHLLDLLLGPAIHNPTVGLVRQALSSLLELLDVNPNGTSLRRSPAQALQRHGTDNRMRFATLRQAAEAVLQAPPDSQEAIAAKRNIKRFYCDLARMIRQLLSMLQNRDEADNLIVITTAMGEDGVQQPLDPLFRTIASLMDTAYGRRLINRVSPAVFLDQPIELGDRYPTLAPLLNNVPHANGGNFRHYAHHLNLVSAPHPVRIAERDSWNRDRIGSDPSVDHCTLYQSGMVEKLYAFCKKNPGCYFELRGFTGCGKSLITPNILAGLGTVLLVLDNDFHVNMMYDFMQTSGYRVEVRTERYAKYGHLPVAHRRKIFVNLHPGDYIEPAIERNDSYEPMRTQPAVEVFLCTYETLRQLIKNRDFPDILILDDVRSKNKHKDLALFMLRNAHDLPQDMIIGGMCAGPLDNARFTFNSVLENAWRPRARHPFQLFDATVGRPFPVIEVSEGASVFLTEPGFFVVRRIVHEPDAVRTLLLDAQRPDLAGLLDDVNNQGLFRDYLGNNPVMTKEQFAEWVAVSFFPNLTTNNIQLWEIMDIVADTVPQNRNELPVSEHTRLISGPQIDAAIRFYESKCTNMNSGNCIVFLPSIEAVILVNRYLRNVAAARLLEVVPIVGPHSVEEIEMTKRLLGEDENGRIKGRVVLLSPEAEASVTISYVSYIIDCGLKHHLMVDNETGIEYSLTLSTNQQEHAQRVGRGGRTATTVYLKLPPNEDPDVMPAFLNDRASDRVEIRTLIMELLTLNAYRGADVPRNVLLGQLTTWFPDINMNLLDATLALMETDGICSQDAGQIFLTGLGFLVSSFPGTYDECFLVAIGALYGCFRSMTSYVVCRNALNDYWSEDDHRAVRWRVFFARGEAVRGDSHLDFIMSTMFWFLKNENDNLACLRANVTPARFVDLKYAIHRYEIAMFSFGCVREEANPTLSWNYSRNDDSAFVRRMALFAGSHGNIGLYDDHHHVMTLDSGHQIPRKDHPFPIPPRCPMFPAKGLCVFTKLRASAGNNPDEVFGVTCGGFLLPLLSIDVTQPNLVDLRTEDGSLILRNHLVADGAIIEDVIAVRRNISNLVKSWLAGNWIALDGLTAYVARISTFCCRRHDEIPDFDNWNTRMFLVGNPFPPAGLARRRRWCSRCLHQGHIFDECMTGIFEARNRHNVCHLILRNVNLQTPVRLRSDDVMDNQFRVTYDANGEARCCHTCFNLFHRFTECRSAVRADGCIRCARLGHPHTACDNPHPCNNCGLRIHVTHRCAEDRLLLQQVYHMNIPSFIRRVLIPSTGNNGLWTPRELAMLRPPAVTAPYFLYPRVDNNIDPSDPSGPEREIFEDVTKGLI